MPVLERIDDHVRTVGDLTDDDVAFLRAHLEEESTTDRDYYLDRAQIEMLAELGASPELIEMLDRALGDDAGMDVAWRDGTSTVSAPRGPFR